MILKHKTAVSKNVYFDVLEVIVNKYNSTVHRTKMEPINVTSNSYPEYNEDSNEKDSKFNVGDHVRISKYKKFLLKDIPKIGQKKFLSSVKLKTQFRGHTRLVS